MFKYMTYFYPHHKFNLTHDLFSYYLLFILLNNKNKKNNKKSEQDEEETDENLNKI